MGVPLGVNINSKEIGDIATLRGPAVDYERRSASCDTTVQYMMLPLHVEVLGNVIASVSTAVAKMIYVDKSSDVEARIRFGFSLNAILASAWA